MSKEDKINLSKIASKAQDIKNPRKKTAAGGEVLTVTSLDSHPDINPNVMEGGDPMPGGRVFDGTDWAFGWTVFVLYPGIYEIRVKAKTNTLSPGKYLVYVDDDSGRVKKIG